MRPPYEGPGLRSSPMCSGSPAVSYRNVFESLSQRSLHSCTRWPLFKSQGSIHLWSLIILPHSNSKTFTDFRNGGHARWCAARQACVMSARALPAGLAEAIVLARRKRRALKSDRARPEDLSGADTEREPEKDTIEKAAASRRAAEEASRVAVARTKPEEASKRVQAASEAAQAKARASALLAAKQKRREAEQANAEAIAKQEQEAKIAEAREIAQRLQEQQSRARTARGAVREAVVERGPQKAGQKRDQDDKVQVIEDESESEQEGSSGKKEEESLIAESDERSLGSDQVRDQEEEEWGEDVGSGSEEAGPGRGQETGTFSDLESSEREDQEDGGQDLDIEAEDGAYEELVETFVAIAGEAEGRARRAAEAAKEALIAQERAHAAADATFAATARANLAEDRQRRFENLKEEDKARVEVLQQERERVDRLRGESPSPDLYLDRLADRDETFAHGNSLVPHRLLPDQSPESSRSPSAPLRAYILVNIDQAVLDVHANSLTQLHVLAVTGSEKEHAN